MIATYIFVLGVLIYGIFPSYYGLNLSAEKTSWNYELVQPYIDSPGEPIQGEITFWNGPLSALIIDGNFQNKNGRYHR